MCAAPQRLLCEGLAMFLSYNVYICTKLVFWRLIGNNINHSSYAHEIQEYFYVCSDLNSSFKPYYVSLNRKAWRKCNQDLNSCSLISVSP